MHTLRKLQTNAQFKQVYKILSLDMRWENFILLRQP